MIRRCALGAILLLLACAAQGFGTVDRVSSVSDGDTLVLAGGETVRLAGIDAPELSRDGRPAQAYAFEAKRFLQNLVSANEVFIEPGGTGRDRYGRLLAQIRTFDGRVINELMLEAGWAYVYVHGDMDTKTEERYLKAQHRAMDSGRGFWPKILAQDQTPGAWVGNSRSKRFHTRDCPDGSRISDRNRVFLMSLKEAFRQGYAPCRKCTVWPLVETETGLP
jgi:micrococcal nuclease